MVLFSFATVSVVVELVLHSDPGVRVNEGFVAAGVVVAVPVDDALVVGPSEHPVHS